MVNPNSTNFAAHQTTVVERDGEIMPAYDGPNRPVYSSETRDQLPPHDFAAHEVGANAVHSVKPEIPAAVQTELDAFRSAHPAPKPRDERHITLAHARSRGSL